MTRALVLSCAKTKRPDPGLLPAIDRYNGPRYRMLRRHLTQTGDQIDLWILSAELGLIPGDTSIPDYDRTLDRRRAAVLLPAVRDAAQPLIAAHPAEVFVVAGAEYVGLLRAAAPSLPLRVALGGMGKQLAAFKRWLNGGTP